MSEKRAIPLSITVEEDLYYGHEVRINGQLAAYRAYDGSSTDGVVMEVETALGALLCGKLMEANTGKDPLDDGGRWSEEEPYWRPEDYRDIVDYND